MPIGPLGTFSCPEENVEWEETEEEHVQSDTPMRLVGSGKTLFDVETDRGWIAVSEEHVSMWDWDEMGTFCFQGLGQLGDKWLVLDSDQTGTSVTDQDKEVYQVKSAKVVDPRGPHVVFSDTLEYMRFLGKINRSVQKAATKHGLDVSRFYNIGCEATSSEEEEEEQEQEEEELTQAQEEVELQHMDWEKTAKFMFKEIDEKACIVKLTDQIKEHICLMEKAIQAKDWDQAIRLGALIRPLFRFCPYVEEVADKVWRLNRKILGTDLSHIKTYGDMTGLARTHRYIKTYKLPKELLGNQRKLAESKHNVLYVSKAAYAQFCNAHATIGELVDLSKDMPEGKQVQVEIEMKRVLDSSYIPNQLTYKVRGFKNFDMRVEVW